ncbi:GNAT family N-acetyltransferase [Enterococcus alishanensis]|uniref:GNAT family N-acetyltransferase n=1 Tax=Enterococcus alishanensis TaxID=1303817 RepID=A0ABS6TES0_9ENTE|nr:GNAT family N-acetyltransferase [Enterococcus alishanensis]MBV7391400.1 GNAT family N-acetyltransferase [Enterococcus alishanensis]
MIELLNAEYMTAVMTIWLESNLAVHNYIPAVYWWNKFDDVKSTLKESEVYIYRQADEVLGFVGVQEDYLAGIFVDKEHRSEGIGQQLLNEMKQKHSQLLLNVYQKNQRAIDFYLREGFQKIEKQIDEVTGEPEWSMQWEK